MSVSVTFGLIMSAFGAVELILALRMGKRKHLALAGIGFIAWGAVFMTGALITHDIPRIVVKIVLGAGMIVCFGLGLKFTPRHIGIGSQE